MPGFGTFGDAGAKPAAPMRTPMGPGTVAPDAPRTVGAPPAGARMPPPARTPMGPGTVAPDAPQTVGAPPAGARMPPPGPMMSAPATRMPPRMPPAGQPGGGMAGAGFSAPRQPTMGPGMRPPPAAAGPWGQPTKAPMMRGQAPMFSRGNR
jgi:hypothetical protein